MHRQRGFTLIEAMVTITIVGIALAAAIPSFRGTILQNRLTAATNDFVSAVASARAEATKRRTQVNVERVGTSWVNGWRVVVNGSTTAIQSFPAPSGLTMTNTTASLGFSLTGYRTALGNTTFKICSDDGKGRQIVVAAGGGTTVTRIDSGCTP